MTSLVVKHVCEALSFFPALYLKVVLIHFPQKVVLDFLNFSIILSTEGHRGLRVIPADILWAVLSTKNMVVYF